MNVNAIMDLSAIVPVLMNYASIVLGVMFLLVFTVNIIVEVVKRLVPKTPTDLVVFIVSILVTVLALYIVATIMEITVMWYYAVGAVVLGVFVAYAAMFGFDKFKELYDRLKEINSK